MKKQTIFTDSLPYIFNVINFLTYRCENFISKLFLLLFVR
jgi:hypothetical protein